MKKSGAQANAKESAQVKEKPKSSKKSIIEKSSIVEPQKHTFYVVALEGPSQFNGIIGPLDLYKLHVLVEGGSQPLQEEYKGAAADAAAWYSAHLESQGLSFTHVQTIQPHIHFLWVNLETTPLDSYAHVTNLSAEQKADPAVIAWKTYYIPCQAGTKKEALGFWVCAAQERLGPLSCAQLFESTLGVTV